MYGFVVTLQYRLQTVWSHPKRQSLHIENETTSRKRKRKCRGEEEVSSVSITHHSPPLPPHLTVLVAPVLKVFHWRLGLRRVFRTDRNSYRRSVNITRRWDTRTIIVKKT